LDTRPHCALGPSVSPPGPGLSSPGTSVSPLGTSVSLPGTSVSPLGLSVSLRGRVYPPWARVYPRRGRVYPCWGQPLISRAILYYYPAGIRGTSGPRDRNQQGTGISKYRGHLQTEGPDSANTGGTSRPRDQIQQRQGAPPDRGTGISKYSPWPLPGLAYTLCHTLCHTKPCDSLDILSQDRPGASRALFTDSGPSVGRCPLSLLNLVPQSGGAPFIC
jgi:hypothetical protein